MNREIKFRAWDKEKEKMYDVAKVDIWGDFDQAICDLVNKGEERFDVYLNDVELMQYTGLKDKNGKEIYEGDVVCDRYANMYTPIFRNGIYMAYNVELLHLDKQEPSTQFNVIWKNGCEIIGNIWDNSELLEVK